VRPRVFLLSPARLDGGRARTLLRDEAAFPLAVRLREDGASLGEVNQFLSGLYFRGKWAYARAFARPPAGVAGAYVITSSRGLVPADETVSHHDLVELAGVPIDHGEPRYREPAEASARVLDHAAGPDAEVVLLGSVATGKYVDVFSAVFRRRLTFPTAFVGRGDMSRGGLLLRCVRRGTELEYAPVEGAVRHGSRPPRLVAER
jgi:hypothetical protein